MSTEKRQPNSSSDGRFTTRPTWWTCDPILPCRTWLLHVVCSQVPVTYRVHIDAAVNFKVAQSLDTESCLAAVTRCIARLGHPSTTIEDSGTISVVAANDLNAIIDSWDKAKNESNLAQKKIKDRFGYSSHLNPHKLMESGTELFEVSKTTWLKSWILKA